MTIPPTRQFRSRPVWARYIRRLELAGMASAMDAEMPLLGFPSEAEKADAIEILRVAPEWEDEIRKTAFAGSAVVMKALIAEAQLIFMEASE